MSARMRITQIDGAFIMRFDGSVGGNIPPL